MYQQQTRSLFTSYENSYITKEEAQHFQSLIAPPKDLVCPITLNLFQNPVIALGDGNTYEHTAILTWIQSQRTRNGGTYSGIRSPVTNAYMEESSVMRFVKNKAVADMTRHLREELGTHLCKFVDVIDGVNGTLGDGGFRIRCFVDMSADLSIKGANGNTAIMALVVKDQADLVQYILNIHEDLNLTVENDEGLRCIDLIKERINITKRKGEWKKIQEQVEHKMRLEEEHIRRQNELRDHTNERERQRQRVLAEDARNNNAPANGNNGPIPAGLGTLDTEGVGFFPSLVALQFQGNIPPPPPTFAEAEEKEKARLQYLLKVTGVIAFLFLIVI